MSQPGSISYQRAVTCCLINQLATPGLGSLIGHRRLPGIGQLILSVAGCALILGWWTGVLYRVYLQQLGEAMPLSSHGSLGKWGLICFGAGWVWSLATSWSLLRQARAFKPAELGSVPPRIPGPPPAQPG
ncbi:MAG: hypothetical protein ABSA69_00450 [Verrucomicrobiota bacterium]|jgi:hypothetical protein